MPFKKARVVGSISSLINHLSEDIENLRGPIWYRGHSNKRWKLIPSIYRPNMNTNQNEMHLLKRFKQDATSLLPRPVTQPYEWLFVMRHYLVPTRLLDWTESPLVAMYFAAKKDDADGSLWILRPLQLNMQEGRQFADVDRSLPSFDEDQGVMKEYTPSNEFVNQRVKLNPIAFIYPRIFPRMQAQLSVYTIHHLKKTPIENVGNRTHVWRYIIPKDAKSQIRKELSLLGVREFQLFPEVESVGRNVARGED